MKQKEYLHKIKLTKYLIYKSTDKTDNRWNFLEENILYLINNAPKSNEDAYLLYAKFQYERNRYKESIDNYSYVLDNYPNKRKQCLYGLMKNYIMLNDYYSAFYCLDALKGKIDNDKEADFGLIKALLAYLNNYDVDLSVEPLVYLYSKLEDKFILTKYSLLLDYVIELDFDNSYIIAGELNNYVKQKGFDIDFKPLCILLKDCRIKKTETIELK